MEFNVIIKRREGDYLISEGAELPSCHAQAKNLDEPMKRTKESTELYLECGKEILKERFVALQKNHGRRKCLSFLY